MKQKFEFPPSRSRTVLRLILPLVPLVLRRLIPPWQPVTGVLWKMSEMKNDEGGRPAIFPSPTLNSPSR